MGKKKRHNQSSNSAVNNADSSESESSKDSTQATEANKTVCPHISKAVDISLVRKTIKICKDKNTHLSCLMCSTRKHESNLSKDGWICLRCGMYNCGSEEGDHMKDHFTKPRSDPHYLAFSINNNTIWCFKCEKEVPVDCTKKVQGCADYIKKQCSDYLSYSPARVVTGPKNTNNDELVSYLKQDGMSSRSLQNNISSKDTSKAASTLNLPKVRGLLNLGNTCFFNSVLQCLAQTPGLVDLLREMDVPGEKFHLELDDTTIDAVLEKPKSLSGLSVQLAQMLTEVSGVTTPGDGRTGQYSVNPRGVLQALTKVCHQFEGGDQHDAHELLRHLLDTVHMEDLRRYQRAILSHIGFKKDLDELDEDKKKFGKKMNQKVCDTIPIRPDQIFKGCLVSVLQCTVCGHKSKREEPFLDLSLPVAHEKAHPVHVRRKQNCSSPVEEDIDISNKQVKLQLLENETKKRIVRRHRGKSQTSVYRSKKEQNPGEPTIEEESKKDSTNGEQSDADVEDNEDNICDEQDHKTEIVESGYSSEKQMSNRGSPVTTQSPEDESKTGLAGYQPADIDTAMLLANRAESGVGSIQELTVTIPEEANTECTSQDSVQVNASNGSPDISSDSQFGNLKIAELCASNILEKLPSNLDDQVDRTAMINDWNCLGGPNSNSQDSSLSHSPQYSQEINDISAKSSPKGSPESGNENCNDNMSVYNSLPENVSTILNSPKNSQREEMSGSEERPESRLELHKNRSSPVEPGNPCTELDSGLLKLSLEGMTKTADIVYVSVDSESEGSLPKPCQPVYNAEDGFTLVGGITKSTVPSPPPLPACTVTTPALPVPKLNYNYKIEEGECSLQSCLNQFTTIEMLAGGNKVGCDACTEKLNKGNKNGKTVCQNSTKQLLINKPPPIMIFHLKRFQAQKFTCRKIGRHVDFPLILDISPFCEDKNCQQILYSLYGVVEHSGTLHGGHYVAYVKVRSHTERQPGESPSGQWYYISDSRVLEVEECSVLKTQAYLLFYERIL